MISNTHTRDRTDFEIGYIKASALSEESFWVDKYEEHCRKAIECNKQYHSVSGAEAEQAEARAQYHIQRAHDAYCFLIQEGDL